MIRRSANSYILSPLNVTLHPIGIPSLNLKLATDFLALVTIAFCPEIVSISATAASKSFLFSFASPTPMLITIFSSFGTCIIFLYPNFFIMASMISLVYCSFNLLNCPKPPLFINQSHLRLPLQHGLFYRLLLCSRSL